MTAEINKGPIIGIRHLQALLIFITISSVFIGRLNVGVSLVAMTNAETTNPDFPEYDWTEAQKSYILSSFFWGYIITQVLGGYLSKKFGTKSIMFWGTFVSGICSAITPLCISWGGWGAYCIIRALMGFAQGVIFPCIQQHLARWSPPDEVNRLGALSYTGYDFGTVLSMFVSGWIAKGPMGWPGISYVSAGLAFASSAFWFILAANNATESRFIGEAERNYIESSLKHGANYHNAIIPIPWKAILTSVPFYALLVARCTDNWGLSTLQAQIPAYMNGVLEMDIKNNALYSALPYLAAWIMSYVYLISADILLTSKRLSLTGLRKTFNSVASWIPAATLIGISFLDVSQRTTAIVLMTISVGVRSGATIGSSLNSIDLSPNHASILTGISNTASNIVPIVTPLFVGLIVSDVNDRSQWQIVFITSSVIIFIGNCIFVAFGTAVTQPWDAEDYLLRSPTKLAKPSTSSIGKELS